MARVSAQRGDRPQERDPRGTLCLGFSPAALLTLHPLHRQRSRTPIGPSNSTLFCVRRNRWPAAPKNTEHTRSRACGVLALCLIQFSPRSLRSSLNRGCAWRRLLSEAVWSFNCRLRSGTNSVPRRCCVSNGFYGEPDATRTVSRDSPPTIIVRLIPRLGEAGYNTFDGVDCIFACSIRVRDDSAVYYVLVRIEGKLHHLKCHLKHQSQPSAFALA